MRIEIREEGRGQAMNGSFFLDIMQRFDPIISVDSNHKTSFPCHAHERQLAAGQPATLTEVQQ